MKLICSLVLLAFFVVATVSAAAIEKEPENQSASNANSVKEKRAILVHHTSPIVSYHSPVITTVHHSAPLIHAAPIIHHPVHSVVATHAIHPVYSSHVISHAPIVSYYGRR